jgi:hypothetical protein
MMMSVNQTISPGLVPAEMIPAEREVDPHGELSPEERTRRVEHARKAYLYRLALRSAKVRKRRAWRGEG